MPPDTPPQDRAWCEPLRLPQPAKTFEQKLKLQGGALTLPRHYIYCTRNPPDDRFRPFYERAKREGWGASEIDASHNPHITCPEVLADLLSRIAAFRVRMTFTASHRNGQAFSGMRRAWPPAPAQGRRAVSATAA